MENSFLPFKKYNLFFTNAPIAKPKALISIIHGMGEHSGRYSHVIKMFNEAGYAVTAFDLIGHGKTESKRGDVENYEMLLESVGTFLGYSKSLYPNISHIPFAHSMGGNILANFLIQKRQNFAGAIIQAPWLENYGGLPKFQLFIAKLLLKIWPSLPTPTQLNANFVSKDKDVVKAYKSDALVHGKISPRWFFGALEAQNIAISRANEITIPTLLMHGTNDKLAEINGSETFKNNAKENVTYMAWKNLEHELHNEPEKDKVFDFIKYWLENILV